MEEVLKRLVTIVERMEQDLALLKKHITQLLKEQQATLTKTQQKVSKSVQSTQMPDEEKMRKLWEQLEVEYKQQGNSAIFEFVEKHTKPFLKAFTKANNLPVDLKGSKRKIAEQLIQLLAVNKVISRPNFTRPPKIAKKIEPLISTKEREDENTQT